MITKKLSDLNWDNVPCIKATSKELEMIKEADESGLCNEKEKAEVEKILNSY